MSPSEESDLRRTLGGSLRPRDARRYYIEAMVGAMHADGVVEPREIVALQGLLQRHDLFAALPAEVAEMLIEMSSDAIEFAGGAERRVPVIAGNLSWRLDRLAAFAMACEVAAADEEIDEREQRYLKALRIALRIEDREHEALLEAARDNRAMAWLETETIRTREQAPVLAELLLLRRWTAGADFQTSLAEVTSAVLDVRDYAATEESVAAALEPIARRAAGWQSTRDVLPVLVRSLPFGSDRYWTMVYLQVDELRRGRTHWRENQMLLDLAAIFHYGELQMQLATDDARQIIRWLSAKA